MRKISNRFLAIVICICVICGIMPLSVAAATETATITGENEVTMQRGVTFFGDFYSLTPPDGVTFTNIEWSVSGNLPAGITLGVNSSDGAGRSRAYLDGAPTAVTNGAVSVTINAEATDGTNTYTGSLAVSITVVDSPAHMLLDELIQNAACEVPMATANTEEDVVAWVQNTWLPSLDGYNELVAQLDYGWTITVEAVTIDPEGEYGGFTEAVAGTAADPDGTDGSLTVRFRLDENYNYLDNGKECIIKATECVAVRIEDDAGVLDVTFTPGEGVTLPDGAEVIVEDHMPSGDDLDFVALEEAPALNVVETLSDVAVLPHEFGDGTLYGPDGKEYTFYEKLIINGEEYYVNGAHADGRLLLFDKNGDAYWYDGNSLGQTDIVNKVIVPDNEYIRINGVVYQICFKSSVKYALWLDGKPVGQYDLMSKRFWYFNEEYTPDKVKEKQQYSNYLGTVTTGETPIDGLESGKTYNVSVIGANEISMKNATAVSGTITQTFDVPAEFVGNMYVTYVAYHGLVEGYELGKTFLSEDGKTITATYAVDSFSPFIVYAFVEADEPEIKTLSATIHTEHTGGTSTCNTLAVCEVCGESYGELADHTYENGTCTVCGEADPNGNSGLEAWAIVLIVVGSVAVLGGGCFAVYWFVFRKRK